MTRRILASGSLFALLLLLVSGVAQAAELASDWGSTKQGQVRLLAAPGTGGALQLGLQFRLAPDWKIYWRSPGDAGLPPEVNWDGSDNLSVGETSWPVPDRFSYAGLETFGYEGEVVLPIAATLPDPAVPVRIRAAVSFLTCAAICVPNDVSLSLDLPAGAAASAESGALIGRYAARVPGSADQAGFTVLGATVAPAGKDAVLALRLRTVPPLQKPDLLVEGADGFSVLPPDMVQDQGVTVLNVKLPGGVGAVAKLPGHPLGLTVIDRAAPPAAPRAAYISAAPALAAPAPSIAGLLPILALALLGGFILNFMPCVLPVLSIKLIALVAHSGQGRRATRLGFLASSAGIIVSFLVMAAILIAMRSAGAAVGWGIQFQEPAFLAALAAIVTLFACNLLGWFEITLPWWLAGLAPAGGPSLLGNFLAGAFA